MLQNEKSLKVFLDIQDFKHYQIVRCQVLESNLCKVLYPLAIAYQSDPPSLAGIPPNKVLSLTETDDCLFDILLVLKPGTFLNALVVISEDSEPILSINNRRLINYKQISNTGRTSYLLGKASPADHPYILPDLQINLKNIIQGPELNQISFIKNTQKPVLDFEKLNKKQDIRWARHKYEEALSIHNKHPKTALKLLKDSLVLDPKLSDALVLRIKIHLQRNKRTKARQDLKKLMKNDPGNPFGKEIISKLDEETALKFEIKDKKLINSGYEDKLIYSPDSR